MNTKLKFRHLIVSATQKENAHDTLLIKSLIHQKILIPKSEKSPARCYVACQNKSGLSEIYQDAFLKNQNNFDIITFIHDDVEILDKNMLFTIEKAFLDHSHWDILGLAGVVKYDIKEILKAWFSNFTASWPNSPHKPYDWAGKVWHRHQEKVWPSDYGKYDVEASVVDGLFLSFRSSSIKESPFDLDFDFHHYDMALCVNAHLLGYNIGIFHTPVVHESLGNYSDFKWSLSNKKFLNKYLNLIK